MSDLQLDAFAATARARHRAASKHGAEIAALVPLARLMAYDAGRQGITWGDVRAEAERRGMLRPQKKQRALSWGCAVLPAAGLYNTGRRRLCKQAVTRNDQSIYVEREEWR